jgi:hypothetical protein
MSNQSNPTVIDALYTTRKLTLSHTHTRTHSLSHTHLLHTTQPSPTYRSREMMIHFWESASQFLEQHSNFFNKKNKKNWQSTL